MPQDRLSRPPCQECHLSYHLLCNCQESTLEVLNTYFCIETFVLGICSFMSLSSREPDYFKFFTASHYCCFRSCTGCDTWVQTGVASMTTKPTWQVFGKRDAATFFLYFFSNQVQNFFIKAKWNDLVAGKKCLLCFSLNFGQWSAFAESLFRLPNEHN